MEKPRKVAKPLEWGPIVLVLAARLVAETVVRLEQVVVGAVAGEEGGMDSCGGRVYGKGTVGWRCGARGSGGGGA